MDDLLVAIAKGYAEELVIKLNNHKHGLEAKLSLLDSNQGRNYIWDREKEEINMSMERYIDNMVKIFNPNFMGQYCFIHHQSNSQRLRMTNSLTLRNSI